jgi:polyisoprenoid-binding protein YceI
MSHWVAALAPAALGLVCAGAGGIARADARHYALDPAASRVTIHVGKAGVLSIAGHEHEVVAGHPRGTATADAGRGALSSIDLTFDTGALRVTGKGEPLEDVPKVQQTMLGPECLDAARFPTIRFVSSGAVAGRPVGASYDLVVEGQLTLHGVTRPIKVPVRVDFAAGGFTATGTTELRQTDFGIAPISKAGVVKVKNELRLDWRLVAHPQ